MTSAENSLDRQTITIAVLGWVREANLEMDNWPTDEQASKIRQKAERFLGMDIVDPVALSALRVLVLLSTELLD